MKALSSLALLVSLCLTFLAPPQTKAEEEVNFDYFYEALAPYGSWVEVEGYGLCWSPRDVDADWAPYTEGQWVYTDAGWTWVGDEEFAGIVYHYGRWIYAVNQGWCWLPGYEWGPGWVSWRDNDEYIGWAPLPPEVVWPTDQGVGIWVDEVYNIGPSYYSFCHHRDFGRRHLRNVIMARSWNTAIIVQTVNVTNITYNRSSGVVFCGGVNYDRACKFSGVDIPALRLERRRDFDLISDHKRSPLPAGQIRDNTLAIVAPRVGRSPDDHKHLPKAGKVIGQNQVQRGWTGKGASGDLDSVRRKMHAQVEGQTPKTNPARPVAQAELHVIPKVASSQEGRRFVPQAPTVRPALPVTSNPDIVVQPIPQQPQMQPQVSQQTHERGVTRNPPFNSVQQPSMPTGNNNGYTRERQEQPPTQESVVENPVPTRSSQSRPPSANRGDDNGQRQVMRGNGSNGSGGSAIDTYLQRQRMEAEARNQVERQAQQRNERQQNEAAEMRRQAILQQQQQAAMERQRGERAQLQQQQAVMERQREERAQQQQMAVDRQRQERAQQQQQMVMERQRQERAQQQAQQQAATMARERERQNEMQRRPTMPSPPQIQIQPPSNRDSVRKSEDNDDRRKRR